MTKQVSGIIQCKSPLKYKDPGCPTISVMITGTIVEKALLDMGASVNLLPYSIYKQLMMAFEVARNDLPRMIGTELASFTVGSVSRTTKSTG